MQPATAGVFNPGPPVHAHPAAPGSLLALGAGPSAGQYPGARAVDDPRNVPSLYGTATTAPAAGPTGVEANPYISAFQKSLAASRGAIAAQMAAAMNEINSNAAAGHAMTAQLPGQFSSLNQTEGNNLNALASAADAAMGKGGLASFTPASATTDPLAAAGTMATQFDVGAVPLIQQGVTAQQAAQRNALAIAQAQAEAQLQQQQMQFDQSQAAALQQHQWDRQSQAAQYGQEQHMANKQQKNALDLTFLKSTATPSGPEAQHMKAQQTALDKAGVDSFTSDQIPALRSSAQYQFLASITDPNQLQHALDDYARMGHQSVVDLWNLDHGTYQPKA